MSLTSDFELVATLFGAHTAAATHPVELYLLSGTILQDQDTTKRAEQYIVDGVMPKGSRLRVIQGMSEADLQALRQRVRGKAQK
jgi:hypothetical protein